MYTCRDLNATGSKSHSSNGILMGRARRRADPPEPLPAAGIVKSTRFLARKKERLSTLPFHIYAIRLITRR